MSPPHLPPPASVPQPGSARRELLARHRGQRVLVVEDNKINREVAAHLLKVAGLHCELATHGQEAVDAVARRSYAIVLMDMRMPEMSGLAATRAIRAQVTAEELPIIAMTASAFAENRDACLAVGMNDYLAKPVAPEDLYRTLLKWLPAASVADSARAAAMDEPDAAAALHASVLPALPGIDARQALAVTSGNADRYLDLLRRFLRSQGLDVAKLRPLLAAGDHEGAVLIAHSLAGAAANLGATGVAAPAKALETGLRSGQVGHAEAHVLVGRIDAGLGTLAGTLGALAPSTRPMADASAFPVPPDPGLVARIRDLVAQSDVTAAEAVRAARQGLLALFGARVEELESLLCEFDFEGAAHWLATATGERDTMGAPP